MKVKRLSVVTVLNLLSRTNVHINRTLPSVSNILVYFHTIIDVNECTFLVILNRASSLHLRYNSSLSAFINICFDICYQFHFYTKALLLSITLYNRKPQVFRAEVSF